jgi:hypothetical protein
MTTLMHLWQLGHQALHTTVGQGVVAGVLAAAAVDYHAFKAWQSWHEFATYSWGTASFRWMKGAVVGAVTALGIAALL